MRCLLIFSCSFVHHLFFFFKQKTAYEMRISDWSSDVCSSDLAELVAQLDTLSAAHEARVGANPPWTRAKMNPALFSKMTGAIVGFEMRIVAWRPTIKLSQNKSTDERGRVIAGVEATGHGALAELMRHLGGDREGA